MSASENIVLQNVSRFYGEVLGVNRVNLDIPHGLTSLVGPNGSGKSTLMHLITGLLRPSRGEVTVLGVAPKRPHELYRMVGYCTQYDSFPAGATGLTFLRSSLELYGLDQEAATSAAWESLATVGLEEAGNRRIAGYSKGMRQRVKLAHACCHEPQVLVLDEPLNGLDPMARVEIIDLLQGWAAAGRHVIVSSHILHEVDVISDRVIMIHGGTVVAEGSIRAVRGELTEHPMQVLVRCDTPYKVAAAAFALGHVVEAKLLDGDEGVLISTRDADSFFRELTDLVMSTGVLVETVTPADENVHAVYDYLIGGTGGSS